MKMLLGEDDVTSLFLGPLIGRLKEVPVPTGSRMKDFEILVLKK
jgi:hypothetical protein